eukprot:325339-Rhodomonas_salina.1
MVSPLTFPLLIGGGYRDMARSAVLAVAKLVKFWCWLPKLNAVRGTTRKRIDPERIGNARSSNTMTQTLSRGGDIEDARLKDNKVVRGARVGLKRVRGARGSGLKDAGGVEVSKPQAVSGAMRWREHSGVGVLGFQAWVLEIAEEVCWVWISRLRATRVSDISSHVWHNTDAIAVCRWRS